MSLVSFTRSAQPLVVSDYVLNGTVISRSTIVRDLGVVFSADLSPDKHIDYICGKALRMLNFMTFKEWSWQFEASHGLLPLSTGRQQADALFLWGVLRGTVDCPDLLYRIDLRASRLTRSCNLFFGRSHPTNYIMHGPLPRLHRLGNQLCRQFDFFDDSQSVIRGVFQSRVPQ
ncbi:hypothetical protein J6590_042716 [Homalodisca vitripennis]|nr:hypothetical protein J6590_042716 [Homalodisca vitripennis]